MSTVRMKWDTDELDRFVVDISKAPIRIQTDGPKTLRKAARLVDRQMYLDARGHQGNWFGIPGTEYDTPMEKHVSHELIDPYLAEIGIEYAGAGKLAHIIVYGSVNNAPVYDHTQALWRSMPVIASMFGATAEDSVLGTD